MANTPSPDNYTLGRGQVYFSRLLSDGSYDGFRDLGNAPNFNINVALEKLDHFSSRSGLKAKDKSVIVQVTPAASFVLDEINEENLAMAFMANAEAVAQVADDEVVVTITKSKKDRYFVLNNRNVGVFQVAFSNLAGGPFQAGETITGGTSSATAKVLRVDASGLLLGTIAGTFVAEQITGDTSSATADIAEAPEMVTNDLLVTSNSGSTIYTGGTDYVVKSKTGRIYIPATSGIADDTELDVTFARGATNYNQINSFTETEFEGQLMFIADNPVGQSPELTIWRASLTPGGDTGFIGDDWMTMEFSAEILKDETGHPDNPYVSVVME